MSDWSMKAKASEPKYPRISSRIEAYDILEKNETDWCEYVCVFLCAWCAPASQVCDFVLEHLTSDFILFTNIRHHNQLLIRM